MSTPSFTVGQMVRVPLLDTHCWVNRVTGDLVECFWVANGSFYSFSFDVSLVTVAKPIAEPAKATIKPKVKQKRKTTLKLDPDPR